MLVFTRAVWLFLVSILPVDSHHSRQYNTVNSQQHPVVALPPNEKSIGPMVCRCFVVIDGFNVLQILRLARAKS